MAAEYLPLSKLISSGREPATPAAIFGEQSFSWLQFTRHVAALAEQIRTRGAGRWLLHTENSYAFAVGLFGLWHADSIAVLPPNTGKQTLEELGVETQGVISDHLTNPGNRLVLDPLEAPATKLLPGGILERNSFKLELYTSGSTGERKAIKKTLGNLEDELDGLQCLWGPMLGDAEIFSTVSHQHIYGLLFRVLWPLSANRVFRGDAYISPSRLLAEMRTDRQACLVSGPAHLKRMPELVDLAELGLRCQVIFSSGGPLGAATSHVFSKNALLTPFELFGSTETGGIAWRQQTLGAEALWKPFRNVEIRAKPPEGFLQVRSPFLGESDPEGWFTTGDLIESTPCGGFIHQGRGDQIIKVEEKRLSLPDMEAKLEAHPWVETAKVFLKEDPPFLRRRPPLVAVLVLNSAGRTSQVENTDLAVIRKLKQALSEAFDPVLFPRSWKFVETLPTDPQGKITVAILRSLVGPPAPVRVPQVLEKTSHEEEGSTVLSLKFHVPENLLCCDGHFKDYPVVPGVAQVHWAADYIGDLVRHSVALMAIESLKFYNPLLPGQNCLLELQHTSGTQKINFRFYAEQHKISSGRFVINSAPVTASG